MQYLTFNGFTVNNNSKATLMVSDAKRMCDRMVGTSLKRKYDRGGDIVKQPKTILVHSKYHGSFISEQLPYKFTRPSENPLVKLSKIQNQLSYESQTDYYNSLGYKLPTRCMSQRTKSKIKNKIKAWYISNFVGFHNRSELCKFSLVTLTLTEEHKEHKLAYKILNNWLTDMRKTYGKFTYLWVAELQDGKRNGYVKSTNNVHFHMFIDRYFDVQTINDMWVKALRVEGMPSRSKQWSDKNQQPLDLEPLDNLKKMMSYVTKYVTKAESKLSTRLWACSKNLSQMSVGVSQLLSNEVISHFQDLSDDVKVISKGIYHFVYKRLPKLFYSFLEPVIQFNKKVNQNYFNPLYYETLFP